MRRSEQRPTFRSVANAIRTGIFIERIYRRMSSSQLMTIPQEVQRALKVRFNQRSSARLEAKAKAKAGAEAEAKAGAEAEAKADADAYRGLRS